MSFWQVLWQAINSSFVQGLFAALVGALVGAYLGARWGFRYALKKDWITSEGLKAERRRDLLGILKDTLTKNREEIKDIIGRLESHQITTGNVDVLLLDHTAYLKYELINSDCLNSRLEDLRWTL
jgi:hypothetical protein